MTDLNRESAELGEYSDDAHNDNGESLVDGRTVASIAPSSGLTGTKATVTVTGTGFDESSNVTLGGETAATVYVSDTSLKVDITPSAAGVTTVGVAGATGSADYTATDPAPPGDESA